MKKILMCLMILALTCACTSTKKSDFDSQLSYGQDIVASFDNVEITYQELYELLLQGYGSNQILNKALMYIADLEITDQSAIDAEVEDLMELYNTATSDNLLSYVQTLGYETLEEYKEDAVIPNAKQSLLLNKYVDLNYETLSEEYSFVHLKQITTATESEALQLIQRINNGESYDDVAKEVMGETSYDYGLVNSLSSTIDTNVAGLMKNLDQEGIYPNAVALSSGKYAVLYVGLTTDEDVEDIKEALASLSTVGAAMETYYLDLYKFDVYESTLIEQINEMGDYLN